MNTHAKDPLAVSEAEKRMAADMKDNASALPRYTMPKREDILQRAKSVEKLLKLVMAESTDFGPDFGFLEYMRDDWSYIHEVQFRAKWPMYQSFHYWLLHNEAWYWRAIGLQPPEELPEKSDGFDKAAWSAGRSASLEKTALGRLRPPD